MTGTPSGDLTTTPTTSASTGNIPSTGGTGLSSQYIPLTTLLNMAVQAQDGTQLGTVQGVVIDRPTASTSGSSGTGTGTMTETPAAGSDMSLTGTPTVGSDMNLTGTPAAGSDMNLTGTPTVSASDSGSGSGTGTTSTMTGPRVSYVVIDRSSAGSSTGGSATGAMTETPTAGSSGGSTSAAGNEVLVPWQAFTVSGAGGTSGGSSGTTTATPAAGGSSSGTTTETPAAGGSSSDATATPMVGGSNGATNETPTPESSSGGGATGGASTSSESGTLVLNVSPSVLSSAPAFDSSAFTGTISSDISQYWAGQNLSIPATGTTVENTSPVLITSPMSSITLMDQSGSSFGQVTDLLVETQTGLVSYAVLSGASSFAGKTYVVPASAVSWQSGEGTATGPGQAQLNVPSTAFDQAPSINSMDELDLSTPDLEQ